MIKLPFSFLIWFPLVKLVIFNEFRGVYRRVANKVVHFHQPFCLLYSGFGHLPAGQTERPCGKLVEHQLGQNWQTSSLA